MAAPEPGNLKCSPPRPARQGRYSLSAVECLYAWVGNANAPRMGRGRWGGDRDAHYPQFGELPAIGITKPGHAASFDQQSFSPFWPLR
jgi:hypothetical protein